MSGVAEPRRCIIVTDADGNLAGIELGEDARPRGQHHRDTGHEMALLTAIDSSCAQCEWRAHVVYLLEPVEG